MNILYERLFLKGLFADKLKITSFKNMVSMIKNPKEIAEMTINEQMLEVRAEDLRNNFYITLNAIVEKINAKKTVRQYLKKIH